MNRLQLWKVVSVVFLACGLASAQNITPSQHITTFSAPGAGTGAGQGTEPGRHTVDGLARGRRAFDTRSAPLHLHACGGRQRDLLPVTRHRDHLLLAQPGAAQRDGHS